MKIISRIKKAVRRIIRSVFPQPQILGKKEYHSEKLPSRSDHVNNINRIILGMVNHERIKRNLNPVTYDHSLELHAIRWSKHMAQIQKLYHSGTILENACMVSSRGSPVSITKSMFYCWKKSTQHWRWMMNPKVQRAGFGFTIRGKYAYGAYAFNTP